MTSSSDIEIEWENKTDFPSKFTALLFSVRIHQIDADAEN